MKRGRQSKPAKKRRGGCPYEHTVGFRVGEGPLSPEVLASLKEAIQNNGQKPLPELANGEQLFQCFDCFRVWKARSKIDQVHKWQILGKLLPAVHWIEGPNA